MVGDVLAGRYELEQLIDTGGMASVFCARDRVLDRLVALKILHERLGAEPDVVERFRREARMSAGLSHPNIVTVIDRGDHDGLPFIVFEYVAGENLKQLLAREAPLPVEQVLELAIQVADGLAFAHAGGFIHRDVKPQNVLVNADGRAKVTDFGIARSLAVESGVTQTGTVLGTSDYIAPEQAQGRDVDERSDVYGLGAVLFELLTGTVPFTGENFVAVAMRHINELPPRVRDLRPEVPPRVDAAVAKALAKNPGDRFATMDAFATELRACLADLGATVVYTPADDETGELPALRVRRPRRQISVWPFALVAGLALVAVVGVLLLHRGSSKTPPAAARTTSVKLTGAGSWDPYGDGHEHSERAKYATDGNPSTYWETERYDGALNKPGVGLVLSAQGTIDKVTVTSTTPGYSAVIEAGDSPKGPFHDVSSSQVAGRATTFAVTKDSDRYLVLWITNLGPNRQVEVEEVNAS